MTRRKLPPAEAAPGLDLPYLPYFTHDALAHDWPPGWLPADDWGLSAVEARQRASSARDVRQARGITDTIVGLSERSDARAKVTRGYVRGVNKVLTPE